MKYTIIILGAPESSQGSRTAWHFCQALLQSQHTLERLFFYSDGVHNSTTLASPPQDELDLPNAWAELIRQHQLDAVVCIAAALKRGLMDATEQQRYRKSAANLGAEFQLSGLGQLIDACRMSDRTVTFGV